MKCLSLFLTLALCQQALSAAIPIWEKLNHEEKIGSLVFISLHLIHLYCQKSEIPDCDRVLALYGVSNLLRLDDLSLNQLDPYHSSSRDLLWNKVMSGNFQMPNVMEHEIVVVPKINQNIEDETDLNSLSSVDLSADLDLGQIDQSFPGYDDYNLGGNEPWDQSYPYAVRVAAPPHVKNGIEKTPEIQNYGIPEWGEGESSNVQIYPDEQMAFGEGQVQYVDYLDDYEVVPVSAPTKPVKKAGKFGGKKDKKSLKTKEIALDVLDKASYKSKNTDAKMLL